MNNIKNFSVNKKRNIFLRMFVGGIFILFLIYVLGVFTSPIKNFFYNFTSPIQRSFWTAGESSSLFLGSFFRGGALLKENENLKSDNQKLLSQVAILQSVEQGNKAQSDVSISCQNSGLKYVMAGVIGLDDNDILSINKGSADGIAVGMPVISQESVLFGKISQVYKNFSKIMLVSNKKSVVNVKIQQTADALAVDEIDGVVKGSGGLSAYLDLIPISSEIKQNDVLLTSAIDKSFPKDLLVAKITQTQKNDQKPFQQAQLSLFLNVKTTDNLFVITNYKQPK